MDEINRTCSAHGRLQKCLQNFCRNADESRPLWRPGLRWADNGKMKEILWELLVIYLQDWTQFHLLQIKEEAVVVYFKALPRRNSPGRIEENHEERQWKESVFGARFKPGTSGIQGRNVSFDPTSSTPKQVSKIQETISYHSSLSCNVTGSGATKHGGQTPLLPTSKILFRIGLRFSNSNYLQRSDIFFITLKNYFTIFRHTVSYLKLEILLLPSCKGFLVATLGHACSQNS